MTKKNFFSMLKSFGLPLSTRELHDITQYYIVLADGGRMGAESSSSAVTNVLSFNLDHTQAANDASDARSRFSDKGGTNGNNTSSSGEHADFMGLLRDARLLASGAARRGSLPEEDEDVDIDLDMDADLDDVEDVRSYTQVLSNLKTMLLESTKSLGKHQDDVYRMFARWDTQGMGTVTATQFLRVLARLHVELSDQDQDFLVELLDTNAMGRIDFESLLNFCFSSAHSTPQSDSLDYMLSSPVSTLKHSSGGNNGHSNGALARAPEDFTGETVSAVSTGTKDFSVEHSKASKPLQRPHTASSTLSRPYSAEQPHYLEQPPYGMQLQTHSLQLPAAGSLTLSDDPSPQPQPNQQQKVAYRRMNSDGNYTSSSFAAGEAASGAGGVVGGGPAANHRNQRPQTASGRVNSSSSSSSNNNNHSNNSEATHQQDGNHSSSKEAKKLGGIASYGHLDSIYDDIEVYDGDDALLDEHLALPHSYSSERKTDGYSLQPDQDSWSEQQQLAQQKANNTNFEELATSLTADQHEFDFGSINDIPEIARVGNGSGWVNHTPHERLDFRKGLDYGSERSWRAADGYAVKPGEPLEEEDDLNCEVQEDDPIDHLVLLATQILSTLRDIVMTRYRRGKSLLEIYQHFDRDEKHFFDAKDFVTATSDLRLETSQRVAAIAVNLIALDGYDKVSYGEFKVFVLDSDHKLLELNVQEQLAQQLEQHGRGYQAWMVDVFWNEEDSLNDSARQSERDRQSGTIQKSAFTASLQKIGAVLTSSELSRLVDRFDLHGSDMCSVSRFVRMIQTSDAWRHAEKVLCYQEEAKEEAHFLRQQLRLRRTQQTRSGSEEDGQLGADSTNTVQGLPELPEELINICEYLGIRVLSEQNMLWIAADALKAPLPVSWTAQKDENGRTFFHNHLTNQSRWEHPLDPHFRKLRDKYRQSNAGLDSGVGGRSSLVLAGQAIRERSGSGSVNSCGFGGSTPPLPTAANSNSSNNGNSNAALAAHPTPARPRPPVPSPVPPEDPTAAALPTRPKSALPERTEHQQLAYRSLQLVPPQQKPPLQPKPQQPLTQQPQPQHQQHLPRPGSAPAVAPSPMVPANGLLYSMTLSKELKPFNPLATNNSFIPSLEVRNKLVTEAIYAPVPLFRPAPRHKQQQKTPTNSSVINAMLMSKELDLSDWEADHSKGDLRFYVSSLSNAAAAGGTRSRPSTPLIPRTTPSNSNRPSSSTKRTAQGQVGGSAVDRAVGLGRSHSGLGLGQRQQRLASMFDGGLIDKLDSIIVARSSSSSALTLTTSAAPRKSRKDGKGGIVLL